jgi:hypothetical protein
MIRRPMKEQPDFRSVLLNLDDQATVRDLLDLFVPEETKSVIVSTYNAHVLYYNSQREQEIAEYAGKLAAGKVQPGY